MEACGEGTLATAGPDGWPLATLVRYALDTEGRPVLRLDPNGSQVLHMGAVDGRCSLHVQMVLPGGQKRQCMLKGRLCSAGDDLARLRLETAWQRRYGKMDVLLEEDDDVQHPLCWVEVEEAFSGLDIGEAVACVPGGVYSGAVADPLKDCAVKIVEDMNREHWEDIRNICTTFAGVEEQVEEASMIWVDCLGFDLRVLTGGSPPQLRDIRVPFTHGPVSDERDARSKVTMMAQVAWEQKRKYIPFSLPLTEAQPV